MSILMTSIQLTRRSFIINTILFFCFLTWYYIFSIYVLQHVFGTSTEIYLMVNVSLNFIIVVTLLSMVFFIHFINKLRIIYECSIITSIVTLLLLFVSNDIFRLTLIFVAGVSFSIGQLVFFTYFWNSTAPEERGRIAGFIGFFSLPFFYVVHFLVPETFDFSCTVMLCIVLSLGTMVIKLLKPEKKETQTAKKCEKGYNPEKRTILLYLVPWALFSLTNATLARNISFHILQRVPFSSYMFLLALQLVAAIFGALGGGIIADFFGRRLSLAFGLTLYGISSALAGLIQNYEMFSFAYFANGLNWGILLTLYLLVVWGDLTNKEKCAKMYAIGLITFYLTTGFGILLTPQISQLPLIVSSLAICLLLFLSNIPVILAPELLSSDFRQKIKLKLYMNVVKKIGREQSHN